VIIAKQKELAEILQLLEGKKKIFLTGCSQCATTCKFGGEEEVARMAAALTEAGKEITGTVILDPSCISLKVKKDLRKAPGCKEAEAILVMACGDGCQTVAGNARVPVYPANDTLFIGEVERVGRYKEVCRACGSCELGWTAGICPVARCAKGLLNGPCGGSKDGKCEVDPDLDCAWILIYEALKERNELDNLRRIRMPRDHRKARRLVVNQG
jgi:hypothetical protein